MITNGKARAERGLADLRAVALLAVAADALLTVAYFSLVLAVSLAQVLTVLAGVVLWLRRADTTLAGILRDELGPEQRPDPGATADVAATGAGCHPQAR